MKYLCILLLMPLSIYTEVVFAEIFKCTENGKIIFSDSPCGASAKVILIDVPPKSGSQLSNEKMNALADEMYTDRRKGELDRSVTKQLGKIESIELIYNKKRTQLQTELSEHKAARKNYKWNGSSAKRASYKEKKNDLYDAISNTKRKYQSDRRLAYLKLSQLKEERREFSK